LIELESVTVRLGGRDVVREVSLRAQRGCWLALVGPNGAGKSSLLGAISGRLRYLGRMAIDGRSHGRLGRRGLARLLAAVPQAPLIPADMTVGEFVLLGRIPHLGYLGREGVADRRAAAAAVRQLDLGRLEDRHLSTLSGGERQRAMLARALAQRAPILLLDEPTAALDLGRQQELLELLAGLHARSGLTVISAMHDLTLAGQYAERVALLDAGRLVACGRPEDILDEAAVLRHYGATVRVADLGPSGRVVVPVRPVAHRAGAGG
jgi:iron complex transport system ATP-binding protein